MSNTKIVPEINIWVQKSLQQNNLGQKFQKKPITINETEWSGFNSILTLLFSHTFDYSSYGIFFRKSNISKISDTNIVARARFKYGVYNVYSYDVLATIGTTGDDADPIEDFVFTYDPNHTATNNTYDSNVSLVENIFGILYGDIEILDILKDFKSGSTVVFPGTIVYDDQTDLGKLIYLYLNYEINNSTNLLDSETSVTTTSSNVLEKIYEKWLIDHFYNKNRLMKSVPLGSDKGEFFNTTLVNTLRVTINQTDLDQKYLLLPSTNPPFSSDVFRVYHKYGFLKSTDFDLLIDDDASLYKLSWDNKNLESNISLNDILYTDWAYLTSV